MSCLCWLHAFDLYWRTGRRWTRGCPRIRFIRITTWKISKTLVKLKSQLWSEGNYQKKSIKIYLFASSSASIFNPLSCTACSLFTILCALTKLSLHWHLWVVKRNLCEKNDWRRLGSLFTREFLCKSTQLRCYVFWVKWRIALGSLWCDAQLQESFEVFDYFWILTHSFVI